MSLSLVFGGQKFVEHLIAADQVPPIRAIKFDYLLAGNGLFIRAKRKEFSVCLPIYQGSVSGLPPVQSGITWHQERIPDSFWAEIWQNARSGSDSIQFREDVYVVFWNETTGGWDWKSIGKERNWASTIADDSLSEYGTACLELHTHPNGAIHFSRADDRDEKGKFRLFGILIDVHSQKPQIRFRCGVYDYFTNIPADYISELTDEFIDLNKFEQSVKKAAL